MSDDFLTWTQAIDRVTRALQRTGLAAAAMTEALQRFERAMRRRHRSGHRHRGTRAWARRYEHRP